VTSDAFFALRAFTAGRESRRRSAARPAAPFRSRRSVPRTAEGRWRLVRHAGLTSSVSATARMTAVSRQLLTRHGVLTREALAAEGIPGGFSAIYPALKAMDDAGRVRRGYFVSGLGATQFALPAALDLLRSLREPPDQPHGVALAAADPANPYGTSLPWPAPNLTRVVGATALLVDGALAGYLPRGDREITVFLPEVEPFFTQTARAVAEAVAALGRGDGRSPRPIFIQQINGQPAIDHPFGAFLEAAGLVRDGLGFHPRAESIEGQSIKRSNYGGVTELHSRPVATHSIDSHSIDRIAKE
jgi:ATP-dependent Lhr-like helicase